MLQKWAPLLVLLAREEVHPGHTCGSRQSSKQWLAAQHDSHSRAGVFGQSLSSNLGEGQ